MAINSMRIHRFYIGGKKLAQIEPSGVVYLRVGDNESYASLIHQWRDVFRYTVGSRVQLFDDSKAECVAMIETIQDAEVKLVVLEKNTAKKSQKTSKGGDVWLFQSIIKNDNIDLVIQKATELGADHIVPVVSDRTIKKNVNKERAGRIAIEASEQSGRVSVPVVHDVVTLKKALQDFLAQDGDVVVCVQDGEPWSKVRTRLKKYPLGFVVGPEGGWSPAETEYFNKSGFIKLALGENVLRAETAALAVLVLQNVG